MQNAISYTVSVGDEPKTIAPSRSVATARRFSPGTYKSGSLFRMHNGMHYLALEDVTISEDPKQQPKHRKGLEDGLLATPHKSRVAIIIQNGGSENIRMTFDQVSEPEDGLVLEPGKSFTLDWSQVAVRASTASGSSDVRVTEVFR